ncbi:MAG: RNA methyltransferase [Vicinamibacterales bacterium]
MSTAPGVTAVLRADDPRIAAYGAIGDHRALTARGVFVAEGRLVVARLLARAASAGRWHDAVESVLLSDAAYAHMRDALPPAPAAPLFVVPQPVMNTIVGFNIHRGCLALVRRPAMPSLPAALEGVGVAIALEGVNNPDNVGGIFRSGAALGADLVLLGPGCADPLYRKSVRTSMGAVLELTSAPADPWPDALAHLRRAGVVLAALTPDAGATPLSGWRPGTSPIAIVAGAEGPGLSAATLDAADVRLSIPMTDRVDSLNVHTAVAIALYHVRESRTS